LSVPSPNLLPQANLRADFYTGPGARPGPRRLERAAILQKATAIGIYFHQATLFGVWTQLYLTALAIGVIVLVVAGYRMWWLRRPPGSLGAPQRAGPLWRAVLAPLMVLFALLAYAMRMLAVSFLLNHVVERLVRRMRKEPASA
jgi:uncharacterized iron-regulated membrane protein